jgi:hypothetical protein
MPFLHEEVTDITMISVLFYELLSFDDIFFNEPNIEVSVMDV